MCLPSSPSAPAERVLDDGATMVLPVLAWVGLVTLWLQACFAVAAFSSRGARARRWCSLRWRESPRRLGGLSVASGCFAVAAFSSLSAPSARSARLLNAGALCEGVSRSGGSVASARREVFNAEDQYKEQRRNDHDRELVRSSLSRRDEPGPGGQPGSCNADLSRGAHASFNTPMPLDLS